MITKSTIPNRRIGEEIISQTRRHWFIFLLRFLFHGILLLVPVGVYGFISVNMPALMQSEIGYGIALVILASYYLIMLVFLLTAWTELYLDIWTITTNRIINVEQHGLFNRVVAELDLIQVQDVAAEQKGLFATFLHFGDVHIQSAGERQRFIMKQIPQPYDIAKIIKKLNDRAQKANQN